MSRLTPACTPTRARAAHAGDADRSAAYCDAPCSSIVKEPNASSSQAPKHVSYRQDHRTRPCRTSSGGPSRYTRVALAGTSPTARDRREFRQMGTEKMAAFAESWNAMATQAFRANYLLATSFWRSWLAGKPSQFSGSQLQNAALGVLGKGLGPVHRRAVANAKRLARTRLR